MSENDQLRIIAAEDRKECARLQADIIRLQGELSRQKDENWALWEENKKFRGNIRFLLAARDRYKSKVNTLQADKDKLMIMINKFYYTHDRSEIEALVIEYSLKQVNHA